MTSEQREGAERPLLERPGVGHAAVCCQPATHGCWMYPCRLQWCTVRLYLIAGVLAASAREVRRRAEHLRATTGPRDPLRRTHSIGLVSVLEKQKQYCIISRSEER